MYWADEENSNRRHPKYLYLGERAGVAEGDIAQPGDDDCAGRSGSRAPADRDSTAFCPYRRRCNLKEKLASDAPGVSAVAQALLGQPLWAPRLLGGAWINELRITNFISSQFKCLPLTLRGSELAVGASSAKVARTTGSPSEIPTERVRAIHKHSLLSRGRQSLAPGQ